MTKYIKIIITALLTLTIFGSMGLCLAAPFQNSDLEARITLDPGLKPDNSPGSIVSKETLNAPGGEAAFANYMFQVIAGALINLAAPVAIIIIAVGGFYAVVSHGDQGLMGKAKKTVQWGIIGLLIIIFSWVIIRTTISIVFTTNANTPAAASTAK